MIRRAGAFLALLVVVLLPAGCGTGAPPDFRQEWQAGETRRYAVTVEESYLERHHLPLAVTDSRRIEPTIITRVRAQVFMTCTGTDSEGNYRLDCGYDSYLLTAEASGESTCLGFSGDTMFFYNRAGFALAVPAALAPSLVPTVKKPWRISMAADGTWQQRNSLIGADTCALLAAVWREMFPLTRGAVAEWEQELPLPAAAPADKALRPVLRYGFTGIVQRADGLLARVRVSADNDLAGMALTMPGDTYGLVPPGTSAVFEDWREKRDGDLWFSRDGQTLHSGDISITYNETVASRLPDPLASSGEERFARTVIFSRHFAWQLLAGE